jgi:hypothetical protein
MRRRTRCVGPTPCLYKNARDSVAVGSLPICLPISWVQLYYVIKYLAPPPGEATSDLSSHRAPECLIVSFHYLSFPTHAVFVS